MRSKLALYTETAINNIVTKYPDYRTFLSNQRTCRVIDTKPYYTMFKRNVLTIFPRLDTNGLNIVFRILTESLLTLYPHIEERQGEEYYILTELLVKELISADQIDTGELPYKCLEDLAAIGIDIYEMFRTNNGLSKVKLLQYTPIMWLGVESSSTLIIGVSRDINTSTTATTETR